MNEGDEGGWQDVLRTQQEELRRLEMMNDALDAGNGQLDADINKALKKASTKSPRPLSSGRKRGASGGGVGIGSPLRCRDLVQGLVEEVPDLPDVQSDQPGTLPEPAPGSPDIDPKAPDTALRWEDF